MHAPDQYEESMVLRFALASVNVLLQVCAVYADLLLTCLQVENRAALYNFASIATAADGVIISRGNLGLDVAPEKMALVQKSVVSKCNLLGKPVVITRVVDTMATAPRPTRLLPAHHKCTSSDSCHASTHIVPDFLCRVQGVACRVPCL